jgi:hypothetical protein
VDTLVEALVGAIGLGHDAGVLLAGELVLPILIGGDHADDFHICHAQGPADRCDRVGGTMR